MSKWIKSEISPNVLQFKKDEQVIKIPKIIGEKYEVEDILSVGGYGVILEAKNKRLKDREVLIKTSLYNDMTEQLKHKYDVSRAETINERRNNLRLEFHRLIEFRNGGECRMPSVIDVVEDFSPQIYGPHTDYITGETFYIEEFKNNEVYVIMQKIGGTNLGKYIHQGIDKILEKKNYKTILMWEKDVLEYMKEVVNIFENFHRRNYTNKDNRESNYYYYIYQDLKPHNIMITYDKFITLIDFGGLLMVGNENGKIYSNYEDEGIAGCGTYGYMPREMKEHPESLDYKADIYTIGATMYSLLTGKNPLDGVEGSTEKIPTYNLKKMGYTDEIIQLVEKATSIDKNNRHTSVRYLLKDIVRCLGNVSSKINKM